MLTSSSGPRIPARKRSGATSAARPAPSWDESTRPVTTCAARPASDAERWVQGRARVELGRVALRAAIRASAASEAKLAEQPVPAARIGLRRGGEELLRDVDGR